jgi:hypothetical protein
MFKSRIRGIKAFGVPENKYTKKIVETTKKIYYPPKAEVNPQQEKITINISNCANKVLSTHSLFPTLKKKYSTKHTKANNYFLEKDIINLNLDKLRESTQNSYYQNTIATTSFRKEIPRSAKPCLTTNFTVLSTHESTNNLKEDGCIQKRKIKTNLFLMCGRDNEKNENKLTLDSSRQYQKQKSVLFEPAKNNFNKCFEINKNFFLENNPSIISTSLQDYFFGFDEKLKTCKQYKNV